MFNFLSKLFTSVSKSSAPSRGASITLTCGILLPPRYYGAGEAIARTGLKGKLQMTQKGKIQIDLEGDYTVIEKLERTLKDDGLFGPRCKAEMVWLPFENKFQRFVTMALFNDDPLAPPQYKL